MLSTLYFELEYTLIVALYVSFFLVEVFPGCLGLKLLLPNCSCR
jgi:hypothetical protein